MIINYHSLGEVATNGSPVSLDIRSIVEQLVMYEFTISNRLFYNSLTETVNLTSAEIDSFVGTISDSIRLSENIFTSSKAYNTAIDIVSFKEAFSFAWFFVHTDNLIVADTSQRSVGAYRTFASVLKLSGVLSTAGSKFNLSVAEALALDEFLQGVDELTVAEQLDLLSTTAIRQKLRVRSEEILQILETPLSAIGVYPLNTETLNLSAYEGDMLAAMNLVADVFKFVIQFTDGADVYTGWVMNTKNLGVTQYTNYNFTGFHRANGRNLAVSSTGLYELIGSTDTGANIPISLSSGSLDLGDGKQSRLESMYFGVLTDQKFVLKTLTGDGVERWYESEAPTSGLDSVRVKLGKGVKSRYWKWTLVTQSNAEFFLDSIELMPVVLNRRIK